MCSCRESAASTNETGGNSAAFVPMVIRLLLDREPELKLWEIPNNYDGNKDSAKCCNDDLLHSTIGRARLCVLALIEDENAVCPYALKRALCFELLRVDATLRDHKVVAACRGSHSWGRRLRLWQALCIVAPHVDGTDTEVRDAVVETIPSALVSPCLPSVRYAIEAASVAFACRWPGHALPPIFDRLELILSGGDRTEAGVSGRELALSSLLAVAGNVVVGDKSSLESAAVFMKDKQPTLEARRFAPKLLRLALALQGSTRGLVRGIAQLLVFALCPQHDPPRDLVPDDSAYIAATIAALKCDPDVARHVERQRRFFWELRSPKLCTLRGILDTGIVEDGDVMAESIVTKFKKCIAETAREIEAIDHTHGFGQILWRPSFPKDVQSADVQLEDRIGTDGLRAKITSEKQLFVQRKIDQLMSEEMSKRTWLCFDGDSALSCQDGINSHITGREQTLQSRLNSVGNKRMPIIVCASLVDKAANLAGLARTAEVLAAEAVVVPNMHVTQTVAFKAVSVTAERWIPIRECPPNQLLSWLRKKRFVINR